MARGMDFRKLRLGEYTAPSSLCLCQYTPEDSHFSRNSILASLGKDLNFITNEVFLIGFPYDKKSANVVMWKDREYEYISSA